MDYGAALEMRFAATRRGFESLPLRHNSLRGLGHPGVAGSARSLTHVRVRSFACSPSPWADHSLGARVRHGTVLVHDASGRCRYTLPCRARRGTSGALYLQSAPAGLNSPSRPPCAEAATPGDVEDRVPRSGDSRTVSGPEGSSTQRISPGAADRPGPSRLRWWARARAGRQGVHGTFAHAARHPIRGSRGSPGAP